MELVFTTTKNEFFGPWFWRNKKSVLGFQFPDLPVSLFAEDVIIFVQQTTTTQKEVHWE